MTSLVGGAPLSVHHVMWAWRGKGSLKPSPWATSRKSLKFQMRRCLGARFELCAHIGLNVTHGCISAQHVMEHLLLAVIIGSIV